ncbi:MAG: hypothetical protein IJF18_00995 [Oscillospiraceae bacterium]|nr:hypothetical protein [Oscillospiraceae bacterium]
MKKRTCRFIAAAMVVVMLMTGCVSHNIEAVKNSNAPELDYDVYANAEITQVEGQPYVLNGMEFLYTGDWKGDRPEGNGEMITSDYCYYYNGTWVNGYLSGIGEIYTESEDGESEYFAGECEYCHPSGQGILTRTLDDNNHVSLVGDFSDMDSLTYFYFSDETRLSDVGYLKDGEYISYVDNDEVQGIECLPEEFVRARTEYGLEDILVVTQKGEYFGQLNEEGLPHGYGYLKVTNQFDGEDGEETMTMYLHALGSWNNGKLDGEATHIENTEGRIVKKTTTFFGGTKEEVRTYTKNIRKTGTVENGRFYGNWTNYDSYINDPPQPGDGLTIKKHIDAYDPASYVLDETDGLYKTDYQTVTYTYTNGEYGESKRRFICEDINNVSEHYAEGEYYNCDKNGTVIDYGVSDKNIDYWVSTMPESEKPKAKIDIKDLAVIGGVIAGGIALTVAIEKLFDAKSVKSESNFWDDWEAKEHNYWQMDVEDKRNKKAKYNELMEKARYTREQAAKETGYKQTDLYNEADALEREANKYYVMFVE